MKPIRNNGQTTYMEAGIPLITFWTKYGVGESYVKERIAMSLRSSL